MGYVVLPEEETRRINDAFLSYGLIMNSMEETERPSIASLLFLIDNSIVEIGMGDIAVDHIIQSTGDKVSSKQDSDGLGIAEEIEYEITVDFKSIEREYDMIGVDKEPEEVYSIKETGQYMYEIEAQGEDKYMAKCAAVDENSYIVLSDSRAVYRIGSACTVRKQSDKRLEE